MDTREVIKGILMGLDASQKLGEELGGVLCSDEITAFYRIESPLIDALMAIICPQENDFRSDRALDISMDYEINVEERADMLMGLREEAELAAAAMEDGEIERNSSFSGYSIWDGPSSIPARGQKGCR